MDKMCPIFYLGWMINQDLPHNRCQCQQYRCEWWVTVDSPSSRFGGRCALSVLAETFLSPCRKEKEAKEND